MHPMGLLHWMHLNVNSLTDEDKMKHLFTVLLAGMCGLKPLPPLPPIGCDRLKGVCVCDDMTRCEWLWVCVNDFEGDE